MVQISFQSVLDEAVLAEILDLLAAATEIEGHRPVGEHKYAHLAVGAKGWVGVLARDGAAHNGQLVGYAHTRWNPATGGPRPRPRMAVEVVVHPDHYGGHVARQLLEATRTLLAGAGGGLLYLWVHRVQDAGETLAAHMGFAVQRELAFMVRALDEAPTAPTVPDGVSIRPYRPGVDDDAFLRVNNAAFHDHPENGGWDQAEFDERRDRDWFDPAGLFMAWRGDVAVGFHWTKWHAHDSDEVPAHEPVGEVYVLAVHPDAQGLGLGKVLLAIGLRHLHGRGCRQAVLYVDTASTGAVALYQSQDFAVDYKEVCYQEHVAAEDRAGVDLLRPAF